MTDRQGFEGLEDVEDRLRGALAREAERVRPDDRLADIRTAVSSQSRRPRWLTPLAAAAAVAAVAVGAWVVLRPSAAPPPPVPASPSATVVTPSTEPSTTGSATSTTSAPPQTAAVALPVYYLAPPTTPDGRYGLVRVFVPAQLPVGATLAQKADAALAAAVTVPASNPNRFVAAWPAGTTATYVALPAPEVGVKLSGPGVPGLPQAAQQLAVQALVWTVTAAAQQAGAPVPIVLASGSQIFESVQTNVFKRPAESQQFQEIATLWVDSPYAGQTLPAGKPVVVTGQACTFEAHVRYELRRAGAVVKGGTTTASSGCPQQGSWTIDLGTLAPGSYEFRAIDVSQKDGSVAFQNIVPFTVG